MTPLERAQAAIAAHLSIADAPIESFALSDGRMILTEALARAVLLAIREPSETMYRATCDDDGICDNYRAMINAALEEG